MESETASSPSNSSTPKPQLVVETNLSSVFGSAIFLRTQPKLSVLIMWKGMKISFRSPLCFVLILR
jgi:hypothetical protein